MASEKTQTADEKCLPSYVKNVGRISHTYRESGFYGQFINTCRLDAWRHALEKFPIDRSRILDIGCSYGSWAENYRALGFQKLCGIEPNPEVVPKAREVFDEVHLGYARDLKGIYPANKTIGANGVLVHILEDDETVKFLSDCADCLTPDGFFLYAVINAKFYYSTDRVEWTGPNSCTRYLETHRRFAHEAGLQIVGEIGTFIDPWAMKELEYLAQNEQLRGQWTMYQVFVDLAATVRGLSQSPFTEVIFVTQKKR